MLVHDLRSPLTSLTMLASLIRPADPESICLYRAGGLRVRLTDFSVQPLLRRIEHRMARLCSTRAQSLSLRIPEDLATINANPELVERVIENLVGNAIVHGPAGKPIVITLFRPDSVTARVEVSDCGAAIPFEIPIQR